MENSNSDKLNVLISIDGSSQATYAFEYYLAHFHKMNMRLILILVAEPDFHGLGSDPKIGTAGELWDRLLEKDADRIKELEDRYNGILRHLEIDGRFEVALATKPGEVICKRAVDEHCTLIVMGCRGLGRVRRTILGSVSQYVNEHAHCPVLICRQPGAGTVNVCGPL